MKKLLLLFTFFVGFNSFAQLTCATATPILANGTIVSPAITGTYQAICWGTAATTPKATWYSYTATQNGEVNLNSDLLQNDGVLLSDDHRVSVATGTCALLACYAGQDDISGTNYRVNITAASISRNSI